MKESKEIIKSKAIREQSESPKKEYTRKRKLAEISNSIKEEQNIILSEESKGCEPDQCPICRELISDKQGHLECGHSFCSSCI